MQQQPRALQVAQELVAQARTFRCAFDQAWNVGNDKTLFRCHPHHPQIRVQRGEGVVCNLRARIGHCSNECGLACIGHAQKADIGQHLEFKLQVLLVARPARSLLARGAVDGAFKAHVAKTAITALGNGDDLARLQQFVQHLAGFNVADDGAHGQLQCDVAACSTKHV